MLLSIALKYTKHSLTLPKELSVVILALANLWPKYYLFLFQRPPGYFFIKCGRSGYPGSPNKNTDTESQFSIK